MRPGGAAGLRAAAFFDLDRTLIAGSSAFEFGRAAYQAGLLSRRQLARDAWENVRFRMRGSTDASTDALKARMAASLEGTEVRALERLAPQVLAGILPRLIPEVLALAHAHQDAGRPVYICTAASQELAELLAIVLRFDGAIGSVAEVVDGRYTGGEGRFAYREGKAQALRELAAERGLDLAASYAYSDSESDVPFLRAVGHPVAVNPDAELARIARDEGWETLTFDHIARHLKVGVALAGAALIGGAGVVAFDRAQGRR